MLEQMETDENLELEIGTPGCWVQQWQGSGPAWSYRNWTEVFADNVTGSWFTRRGVLLEKL